jgi:SAM-dependent methyltransferase
VSIWVSGAAYAAYIGRWSRLVAREFVPWLAVPPGSKWLDVGCGTGALSATVRSLASPSSVTGVDSSAGFVGYAREQASDETVQFTVGDAQRLPFADARFDAAVSGLMLNFLPEPERGLAEMVRTVRPSGVVAVYVWDYSGQMQLMRYFWDAAGELDLAAVALGERRRFPLCRPEPLARLLCEVGLDHVVVRSIDITTVFRDFDDYWLPFLGGQGPAPSYVMGLTEERRLRLRERIRAGLPTSEDGMITLEARAWAARGRKPR